MRKNISGTFSDLFFRLSTEFFSPLRFALKSARAEAMNSLKIICRVCLTPDCKKYLPVDDQKGQFSMKLKKLAGIEVSFANPRFSLNLSIDFVALDSSWPVHLRKVL